MASDFWQIFRKKFIYFKKKRFVNFKVQTFSEAHIIVCFSESLNFINKGCWLMLFKEKCLHKYLADFWNWKSEFYNPWCYTNKIRTFWEEHKTLRNLPHALYIHLANVQTTRKIFSNYVCFSESPKFNQKSICLLN